MKNSRKGGALEFERDMGRCLFDALNAAKRDLLLNRLTHFASGLLRGLPFQPVIKQREAPGFYSDRLIAIQPVIDPRHSNINPETRFWTIRAETNLQHSANCHRSEKP